MKSEIDNSKTQAEKFEREGDLGKVAELRYGKIAIWKKIIGRNSRSCRNSKVSEECLKKKLMLKILRK
jgi:ATP-dependent Clp protease ATP-binding subunit ClpB